MSGGIGPSRIGPEADEAEHQAQRAQPQNVSQLKTQVRKLRAAIAKGDADEAKQAARRDGRARSTARPRRASSTTTPPPGTRAGSTAGSTRWPRRPDRRRSGPPHASATAAAARAAAPSPGLIRRSAPSSARTARPSSASVHARDASSTSPHLERAGGRARLTICSCEARASAARARRAPGAARGAAWPG